MNGFQRHNIAHTSASSINMWCDCPGAWAARYLFDKKFPFGVAPLIGTLVEEVCANVLTGDKALPEALELAHMAFNKETPFASTKDKERISDIELMTAQALEVLEPFGRPHFEACVVNGRKQQKIELLCKGNDWELPVWGFVDFIYPDHGKIFDLKTTQRIPSTMSSAHKRQGAIYKKAGGNKAVSFLYVSTKKAVIHDIENENETLQEIKAILNRQEKLLRLHDAKTLQEILPLNLSSFYWNGAEHIAKELYGL